MAQINFDVSTEKLPRIVKAMAGLYPIPKDKDDKSIFTEAQWAKEAIRRIVIREVKNWEQRSASIAAAEVITADDKLLS